MEALRKETYEKNKAEAVVKVLKDTNEAEKELKETSENKTKVDNPPQNTNSDDDMSLDEVDG